MRFGLRVPDVQGLSMEEKLDLALECRLSAIELAASHLANHEETLRWKNSAEQRGIAITTAGIGINLCNPEMKQDIIEQMKRILEGANLLGGIPLFSRTMKAPEGAAQQQTWDHLISFTREITEMCADAGIRFAIEIDHAPCFIDNLERFERLYWAVNHVNLHLNFDPTNLYLGGSDPFLAIERWGHSFIGGHIKDGVYRSDKKSEVPLGEGEIDYPELFKQLTERGIELTFHFEHLREPDQVRRAAHYVHHLASVARESIN